MLPSFVKEHIRMALNEDIGVGDITTESIDQTPFITHAFVKVKDDGIIAGLPILQEVFAQVDQMLKLELLVSDGEKVVPGQIIAKLHGNGYSILKGERVALNYLQYLSGIATKTRRIVASVSHLPLRIVDTRKTVPGMRWFAKYAVRAGGGSNHRFNLSDGVLLKDNHIKACGTIKEAVARARTGAPHTLKIEVEVETLAQVKEALEARADIIMLDNMSLEMIDEAVKLAHGKALLEVSGGITEDNILSYAQTGIDIISLGTLTHTVKALDISLDLVTVK